MKLFFLLFSSLMAAPVGATSTGSTDIEWCLDDAAYEFDSEVKFKVESFTGGGYWHITEMGDYHVDGETRAWCVDLGRGLSSGRYHFDTYSSYAEDIPDDQANQNFDAVDKDHMLPEVNYLLNTYRNTTLCQNSCGTPGWKEVQQAIWVLIDDTTYHSSVDGYDATCVSALTVDAMTNGQDFSPCDADLDDPVMGLLLVVDVGNAATNGTSDGTIEKQVIIAEMEAQCYDCNPSVGAVVGDPHIFTYDGLTNDCQASGEFILTKSQTTTRQVQARFAHFTETGFWSVTKAVAIQDAYDSPVVQVSIPVLPGASTHDSIDSCGVEFYVDGTQTTMASDLGTSDVMVTNSGTEVKVFYPATGFLVTITAAHGAGICFLNVAVEAPSDDRSMLGLLGTNNHNISDDWTDSSGTVIPLPAIRTSEEGYNYCTDNWCITDAADSKFEYETGLTHSNFNHCHRDYGSSSTDIASQASDAIKAICGTDQMCLVDGVLNGASAAQAYMDALAAVAATCNGEGGECKASNCCSGLACVDDVDNPGEKICSAPVMCEGCFVGTSGTCKDANNVCSPEVGGICSSGTTRCTANDPPPPPPASHPQCSNCWPGTSGVCQSSNTVCYSMIEGLDMCPPGSSTCGSTARRLRGSL